ncbi:MAG TPA: MotA/TolQ/ExbB proton channel family protein [Stellaceae bacterium]|nr:MotA/TolQ/ExbB proton channel family protein [Stellaceae bacterium]
MLNLYERYLKPSASVPVMVLAVGLLFMVGSIALSTRSLFAFFSIQGLVIVGGGVIAVAFMSFETEDVRKALDEIAAMFKARSAPPADTLHQEMLEIVAWAYMVREKGMRRLEASLAKRGIDDLFVKYGLNMVVSGYSAREVRVMMETAADGLYDRDVAPVEILQSMASHAPAFGIIGTVIGMVAMLCGLGDNVAGIGTSLSVAFLSTLYGVVSARMIYMPAAAKLRQSVAKRRFRNQMITEGMVMLVSKKTPMFIQDRLNSFLRPERHDYLDAFTNATRAVAGAPALKAIAA